MNKNITFCLPTAGDERDYTKLALESLKRNTDPSNEIIVYIDSDNLGTEEVVLAMQKEMPNVVLMKNELGVPLGLQRVMTIMIDMAKNDIVCYLQSDMVVSKDVDKVIVDELVDKNTILSLARIEPPLHPPSPEKITLDLGMTPDEFNWTEFEQITSGIKSENRPPIETNFAPFAIYKDTWFELGGFDATFRASREDSDFIVKAGILNKRMIQTWNAMVYHFTCISSRGKDWYDSSDESKRKTKLQELADGQEVNNFIRKWGRFSHDIPYRYRVELKIDGDVGEGLPYLIASLEPHFDFIHVNRSEILEITKTMFEFNYRYYANLKFGYTDDVFIGHAMVGKLSPRYWARRFGIGTSPANDVNSITITASQLLPLYHSGILPQLQDLIHQSDLGEFSMDIGGQTVDVTIANKTDVRVEIIAEDAIAAKQIAEWARSREK